jgi:hypothetical protein
VFEKRVLRKIGKKITGEWRKLLNEKLHNLYSSPNIISVTKSRRVKWAVHVERMGQNTNA